MGCMKTGWIFCDSEKIGSLKQAEALAEKLQLTVQTFDVRLPLPWRYLPPQAGLFTVNPLPHHIKQPYPDVVIGIGRQSVLPTLYMRHFSKTIFIQDPNINPHYFDCVIAPQHDHLSAKNVINIIGSLHKVSPDYIANLPVSRFQSAKPMIAIFIGGNSKHVLYTDHMIHAMCADFNALVHQGYDLLITPSRRTQKEHVDIIQKSLGTTARHIWDLKSDNPYLDYLKAASHFIVTTDSISMMSELCSTGKPTYLIDVGIVKQKFQNFVRTLYQLHAAKPLKNKLIDFKPHVLTDLNDCVGKIQNSLAI